MKTFLPTKAIRLTIMLDALFDCYSIKTIVQSLAVLPNKKLTPLNYNTSISADINFVSVDLHPPEITKW